MEVTAEKREVSSRNEIFARQKARSRSHRNEPLSTRAERLRKLENWLFANREKIEIAVNSDMQKPTLEVAISEIYPVLTEIRHTLSHFETWAQPVKVDATLAYLGTRSEIRIEPKGTCLIISPWNFPFNLCIGPLVSCIAAGNTAILKPSELTPRTARLIREMIEEIFEPEIAWVEEGDAGVAEALLKFPFDHIFFTGSPAVGKIIMRAAAENLTSVTLELGGKSPTVIDATANLRDAAKRIAFGKFINNGQTCIAPDYVMVEETVLEKFTSLLRKEIMNLFGEGDAVGEQSPDYGRIISDRHFRRLNELLKDAVERGARPDMVGTMNEKSRFIAPVILTDVAPDARIQEEEIFGPILPIQPFTRKEEVVDLINKRPKPLALYVFSGRAAFRDYIITNTSAGSVCVNECVLQFTHPNLPFGGVNNSGIGKSHGYYGFMAFSNEKPVLRQKSGWAAPYLLHPPYTSGMRKVVNLLLKWF